MNQKRQRFASAAYVRLRKLYPYAGYVPRGNDYGGTIVWFYWLRSCINDMAYEYGTYDIKSELLPVLILIPAEGDVQ